MTFLCLVLIREIISLSIQSRTKKCGRENHWRKVCRASEFSRRQQRVSSGCWRHSKAPEKKPITEKHPHSLESHGEIEANPEALLPDHLYFHTMSINQVTKDDRQAFVEVKVVSGQCIKPLLCEVDTGAEGNVISLSTYKSFFPGSLCNDDSIPTNLSSSTTVISAFGGHPVDHYSICVLKLVHQGSFKPYAFHVLDVDGPTILGLPTYMDLNVVILNFGITAQKVSKPSATPKPTCDPGPVAKDELLRNCGDCFQGIGCFPGDHSWSYCTPGCASLTQSSRGPQGTLEKKSWIR